MNATRYTGKRTKSGNRMMLATPGIGVINRSFAQPQTKPQTSSEVYREALLQGKKHADNPWIKEVSFQDRSFTRTSQPAAFRRKTLNMAVVPKEPDREADVIDAEFKLPIFKVLDRQEYRQLGNYDTWEHDVEPEVWLQRCKLSSRSTHGVSPVYDGKVYVWQPVRVLDYDAKSARFKILVVDSGQVKMVSRLSLMFYDEDHSQFQVRLNKCRERRENVESELRFQNYVDSLPANFVGHTPHAMLNNILQRSIYKEEIVDKKHSDAVLARLTNVINAIYRRSLKKSLVLQASTNVKDIERLNDINVPVKLDSRTLVYFGLVDVKRGSKKKRSLIMTEYTQRREDSPTEANKTFTKTSLKLDRKQDRMADLKIMRKEKKEIMIKNLEKDLLRYGNATKIVNMFAGDFQKMCQNFKKNRLFQTELQKLILPMRCSQFMTIQTKKINATITDMLNNWRFQILHNMRANVGTKFAFDISDRQKYEDSPIRKLIHKFDLIFHHHVEEFYMYSIEDFVCFMRSFTVPIGDQIWKISPVPLIEIDIRYTDSDKKKEKKENVKDDKHKRKKDDKKKKEREDKEPKELLFKPDINECKTQILSLFDHLIEESKKVNILETEDFNVFLSDKKRPVYDLNEETVFLKEAKRKIEDYLNECLIGPKDLLAQFKRYEYLMKPDIGNYLKVLDKDKSPTAAELKEQLDTLSTAGYEVQTLATDLVRFGMFQVNTEMVKKYLVHRAIKHKNTLLKSISKHCQSSVKKILNSYKQFLSKLEDKPTSKEAYKELKMYLKDSNKRMDELKAQHELVKLNMELLEDNLMKIDKDDERSFWEVHQYPSKLRGKIAKASNNLINYEEQIRIELERQKDIFDKDMNVYQNLLADVMEFNDIEGAKKNYRLVFELHEKLENAVSKVKEINDDEGLLEMKRTEYIILDKLVKDFQPFYSLSKYSEEIQTSIESWYSNPFIGLNPGEIANDIETWNTSLETLNKQLEEFKDQADVALQLKSCVGEFSQHLELIKCLRSEAMKEEDFNEIAAQTPLNIKLDDDTYSLKTLIAKEAEAHMDKIREIWEKAERRLELEKNLKRIKDDINKRRLEIIYNDSMNSYIINNYKAIMDHIDEQIITTQNMLNSPYMVGGLRKNCMVWTGKFGVIAEILEELKRCQKTWMYLSPLFSSEDVQLTLKLETDRFAEVDAKWKQQMENLNVENLVVSLLDKERMKEDFIRANNDLDLIMRSLSDFFESKRKKFPRFYFVSDEDLIKILSQAKQDPSFVEPYLSKCFVHIGSLSIKQPGQEITSIVSISKEKIDLIRPLDLKEGDNHGNVEMWLKNLEQILLETIKNLIKKGCAEFDAKPLERFIFDWPSQVVIAANQLHFTTEVEKALAEPKSQNLEKLEDTLKTRINMYVEIIRGEVSLVNRSLIEALIVLDVHGKTVIRNLIESKVTSPNDFTWKLQLRYNFEGETLKIRILEASIPYGYEYNGNPSRLVISPLTERCFRTLLMAKQMNYGGALTGPAGSGKTETIKDLSKVLGIYCVVFNGSDELDHVSLIKFFKGLASSGVWCCFDEFNKIPSDVLSVLASQILLIQQALGAHKNVFYFAGDEILLSPQCGINITMNPSLNFQANLPDNLKALFRVCAVTKPDTVLIAEILLYSYGFQEPKILAKKLVGVLNLSKEQLSKQGHYNFGLRVLKNILSVVKELKESYTNEREDIIVKKALDEVNLPKFDAHDKLLYEGIVKDFFPDSITEKRDYKELIKSILEALQKENLQPKTEFINKCVQLYEIHKIIHGILLIGESLSGKTTSIQILRKALNPEIELKVLNPKAVALKQLFGYFDDSNTWIDGVLAKILYSFNESTKNCEKWLVFDGPVDIVWMESINSVLDDNKKLCLGSGTSIALDPSAHLFFEVEHLKYTSPAIVSRCGVVYTGCETLGWEIFVGSYCKTLPEVLGSKRIRNIEEYMLSVLTPTLSFLPKHCKFFIELKPMHLVKNFLNLFESFMAITREIDYKLNPDIDRTIPNILIFALIWSLGAILKQNSKPKFKEFLNDMLNITDIKIKYKLDVDFSPVKFILKLPEDIFNITYDQKENKWLSWLIPNNTLPKNTPFTQLVIPTLEFERMGTLLRLLATARKHVLFMGSNGIGKSIFLYNELNKNFNEGKYTYIDVILSALTTANQAQKAIECKLEKRGRKICYGPSQSKHGVIVVEDLNLPQKDKCNSCSPIELLRQWMDYGGWYDITTNEFKYIIDISFAGTITLSKPEDISMRYIRHYNIIQMEEYNTYENVFTSVLQWKFGEEYVEEVRETVPKIAAAAMKLYYALQRAPELKPIPSKLHYAFHFRDIGRMIQGMFMGRPIAINNQSSLIKLWAHESIRTFCGRLSTPQDCAAFMKILKSTLKDSFDQDWDTLINSNSLLFCDFVPCSHQESEQHYCEVTDRNLLKSTADSFLNRYNESNKSKLNIVLFSAAIDYIVQIKRILAIPSGHALLLGVGSSGRRSLISLAAFIANFEVFRIGDMKKYKIQEWHQDLRNLMNKCAVDKIPTVMVISDNQINNDFTLEDLQNLLRTGEIPNLYTKNERDDNKDDFMNKLRENIQSKYKKLFNSDEEILETLKVNVLAKLHIAFCMNPVSSLFRRYVRWYPSLINCTTVSHFLPWPEEGLKSVAIQFLGEVKGIEEAKDSIVKVFIEMQETVRNITDEYMRNNMGYYCVTPASYLELLKVFKSLFQEKYTETINGVQAYENGLEELRKTEQLVAQMKAKLQELEPELKNRSNSAAQLADSLKRKQMEVVEETKIVQKDQEMAQEAKRIADELQAECQADLDLALPELKEAEKQVGAIKHEAISNLAAMGAPPDQVKLVAKALCIILDIKPKKLVNVTEADYWIPRKIFTFKNIKWLTVGFDKENIPLAKITELKKINDDPRFASEKLKSVSEPGEMLAHWIRAIIKFDQINREVTPKKARLKEESEKAKAVSEEWEKKSKQLEEKRGLLEELNQKSRLAEEQKKQLMADIENTRKKIDRARELLDLLKNENKRWNDQKNNFQEQHNNIIGDMLISSGIITYLGIFTPYYRELCIKTWSGLLDKLMIAKSKDYTLFNVLGDPLKRTASPNVKFPEDTVSKENAIIMERTTRWSLMIDPQFQALNWIKSKGNVEVLKADQKIEYIIKRLNYCMSNGTAVLLSDLSETIDSRLNPLLRKDILKRGSENIIQLGGETINIRASFVLYMTTKLPKPHYSPEICSLLTMVNFTVTEEGLIEQTLNIIVKKEDPTTERNREDTVNKSLENKKKLKMREEELLKIVTTHKEGILESEKLLETLKHAKAECQQSIIQVEEQKRFSERIENTRSKFKAVAKRVGELYFCVNELATVDPMYQFSLDWYLDLYKEALEIEGEEENDKLEFYKNRFMGLLYSTVCKSLFEKDKLLFALLIYIKTCLSEGLNSVEEVQFLAKGPTELNKASSNPMSDWLPDSSWNGLIELSKRLEVFKRLDENITHNYTKWKALYNSPNISDPLLTEYNPLQRLILITTIQSNKFIEIAQQLILLTLGKQFCEYPRFNLEDTFALSNHKKPIIIILSPGANPMDDLKNLAISKKITNNIVPLSLGKGQGKIAHIIINNAIKSTNATWVVLQNCHLATSYLSNIEKILEEIPDTPKLDFRLWLTTMPSKDFPRSLLQKCVKVASEKPKGVVQSMIAMSDIIDPEVFTGTDTAKRLVFSLCLFHSIISERGKFGILGWNSPYEFSRADFTTTIEQALKMLKENYEVSWKALDYLINELNYGGGINDPMDLRVLKTIASQFQDPAILKDGYKFFNKKEYTIVRHIRSKDDWIKCIRALPLNDEPEIFGLSKTASLTYLSNDALSICPVLLSLLPYSSKEYDDYNEAKVSVKSILEQIPKLLNIKECINKFPISYTKCLNAVLQHEVVAYNELLTVVRRSVQDLERAQKGEIAMSRELEEVGKYIVEGSVPSFWLNYAYPGTKPLLSWIKDLAARVHFFENWISKGSPEVYWIGAFFYPQGFLVALLQNYARKKKISYDSVMFEHKVDEPIKGEGEYLDRMYIEGATWDKTKKCIEEKHKGAFIEPIPRVLFVPIEISKQKKSKNVN